MPAASASTLSVAVIGGGIAGLTAAYRLHRSGAQVRLLEASDRVGGPLCSESHEGRLFELGPNTVPSTAPRLAALIDDLDLRERVQLSKPVAGRRLLYREGADNVSDLLRLGWARRAAAGQAPARAVLERALAEAAGWQPRHFPLTGQDLLDLGLAPGPEVGALLRRLEDWWIEEDFAPSRDDCLSKAKALAE